MRQYTIGLARSRFSEVVTEAAYGAQRVVLTRHGKSVAAVVPIADLELLQGLERIIDVEKARKALTEAAAHGGSETPEGQARPMTVRPSR
jgi:prevent-host-death family protein